MIAVDVLCYLNGAYEDLARAEVLAVLEAHGASPAIVMEAPQVLRLECSRTPKSVFDRLALTHYSLSYLCSVAPSSGTMGAEAISQIPPGSFCIRIKKIDKGINSMAEERRLSDQVLSAISATVNLTDPSTGIIGVYVGGLIHLGIVLSQSKAKEYNERKPQHRPYFHPSSIDPRIARALVNLAGATTEVLDPFCGTGGILIEAGLMGMDVYGIDIEEKMVAGALDNLAHYHIPCTIRLGDATDITSTFPRHFQSIVTDVPYGKSTVVSGTTDELYRRAFVQMRTHCSGSTVVVLPEAYDFTSCGFAVKSHYSYRVHKSLDRHIYVLWH